MGKLNGEAKAKVHMEQDDEGKAYLVVRLGERDFTQHAPGNPDYPDRFIRVPVGFSLAFKLSEIIAETEFVSPRGIGRGYTPGCIACGNHVDDLYHDCAMFVTSREAGERIVSWFPRGGARLDYRPSEPNWIQVKMGACDRHRKLLGFLVNWISEDNTISRRKLDNTINDERIKSYEWLQELDEKQAAKEKQA